MRRFAICSRTLSRRSPFQAAGQTVASAPAYPPGLILIIVSGGWISGSVTQTPQLCCGRMIGRRWLEREPCVSCLAPLLKPQIECGGAISLHSLVARLHGWSRPVRRPCRSSGILAPKLQNATAAASLPSAVARHPPRYAACLIPSSPTFLHSSRHCRESCIAFVFNREKFRNPDRSHCGFRSGVKRTPY